MGVTKFCYGGNNSFLWVLQAVVKGVTNLCYGCYKLLLWE
jgi:hypothetical protein